MHSLTRSVLHATAPLALLAILAAGCGERGAPERTDEAASADSVIHIPTAALAAGGLRIETVREHAIAETLLVAGQIEADPLRVAHLAPRVSGTIQKLTVVIGDRVRAGDLVAEIYSPEFAAAMGDYLLAHRRLERARAAQAPDTAAHDNIARSARSRLETLGASERDVSGVDERHEPMQLLPLRSPISGVVTEVETGAGKQIQAGTDIFGFTDLADVWGVVDVYERDFGSL